jgi:hypothetical protein
MADGMEDDLVSSSHLRRSPVVRARDDLPSVEIDVPGVDPIVLDLPWRIRGTEGLDPVRGHDVNFRVLTARFKLRG